MAAEQRKLLEQLMGGTLAVIAPSGNPTDFPANLKSFFQRTSL